MKKKKTFFRRTRESLNYSIFNVSQSQNKIWTWTTQKINPSKQKKCKSYITQYDVTTLTASL